MLQDAIRARDAFISRRNFTADDYFTLHAHIKCMRTTPPRLSFSTPSRRARFCATFLGAQGKMMAMITLAATSAYVAKSPPDARVSVTRRSCPYSAAPQPRLQLPQMPHYARRATMRAWHVYFRDISAFLTMKERWAKTLCRHARQRRVRKYTQATPHI